MNVGIQMVLATYGWRDWSDDQGWDEEIRLARLAPAVVERAAAE
ncbi:MAG TPA: hypothetical protein VKF83_09795 [Stellaceae bacterium]|nr:hypothetical protein [Stellaceae bacterium]HMD64252.1 hypothetical protein [Stellaceae bacterium]